MEIEPILNFKKVQKCVTDAKLSVIYLYSYVIFLIYRILKCNC